MNQYSIKEREENSSEKAQKSFKKSRTEAETRMNICPSCKAKINPLSRAGIWIGKWYLGRRLSCGFCMWFEGREKIW